MKIDLSNIEKAYPNDLINYELLKAKKLGDDKPNDKYFKLLNKYKSFFEKYLKEKLPLEQIDNNFKESNLDFKVIEDEDKDFYQITSTMGLHYIYLRNNIYIEKLNDEDINFLSKKEKYDESIREFINRTFKIVINPFEESRKIFYGPENGQFMCNTDDIVIGFRYDEFNNSLEDDEFEKNF